MNKFFEKYYRLIFLAVAVLLLYPTFSRGYIFSLDGQVQPFMSFSDISLWNDSIFRILVKLIAAIFSYAFFQRVFLFLTIYLLGTAGFALAKKTGNIYARYFGGLFFIFNPFIYARLLEQTGIAFGFAIFFWFLIYFLEYLDQYKGKDLILASICAGLVPAIFLHSIFFIYLSVLVLAIYFLLKDKNPNQIVKGLLFIALVIFVLNANWIISLATHHYQGRIEGMANFGGNDLEIFRTREVGDLNIFSTAASLQGYWGERQDRFISIQENIFWLPSFLAILSLAIYGFFKRFRTDKFSLPLVVLFAVSYVLAIGISSGFTRPIAQFLYDHYPYYIGLRESQKWAGVMLFIYAYFAVWGTRYFLELGMLQKKPWSFISWAPLLALLPVFFCYSIIPGTHQSLEPKQFPAQWQEAKERISGNDGGIVFFPWHAYMKFRFIGKNIISPASSYFGKNLIQANNTEFGDVYSSSPYDEDRAMIESYIDSPDRSQFVPDMKKIGVGAVILSKNEDWNSYLWLDERGMDKVLENKELIVYEIRR